MKDMNIAKLTAADLPLFNGITADLFPGIDVPILDYGIVSFFMESQFELTSWVNVWVVCR